MEIIKGIKVPGLAWVILIVIGVALVHENTSNPLYYDLAIMLSGLLLRSITNNRAELEEYQAVIDFLKSRLRQNEPPPPSSEMRSARQIENATFDPLPTLAHPPRPPALVRFLFG